MARLTQPSLFHRYQAHGDSAKRPHVTTSLLSHMLEALDGRGWVAAHILSSELGCDLRTLREIANRSDGCIVGGQRGYARTEQVSGQDVGRVIGRLLSQSSAMKRRAVEIERRLHRKEGSAA